MDFKDAKFFDTRNESPEKKKENVTNILKHIETELHKVVDNKQDTDPKSGQGFSSWQMIYGMVSMLQEMNQLLSLAKESKNVLKELGIDPDNLDATKQPTEQPIQKEGNVITFPKPSNKEGLH